MDENVIINLDGNRQLDASFEEPVYSDRSMSQYETGGIYFVPQLDDGVFISHSGNVYKLGTSQLIGVCPSVKEEADAYEASFDDEDYWYE
jgi:hypothetical protein